MQAIVAWFSFPSPRRTSAGVFLGLVVTAIHCMPCGGPMQFTICTKATLHLTIHKRGGAISMHRKRRRTRGSSPAKSRRQSFFQADTTSIKKCFLCGHRPLWRFAMRSAGVSCSTMETTSWVPQNRRRENFYKMFFTFWTTLYKYPIQKGYIRFRIGSNAASRATLKTRRWSSER
jgi:hypothetical protein